MGTFVDKNSIDISVPLVTVPAKIEGLGTWEGGFTVDAPWQTVKDRFDKTALEAEKWGTELQGYLDELNDIIATYPALTIDYTSVPIGTDIAVTVATPPTMSGVIDTSFPEFSPTPYSFREIPNVDTSAILPLELPADITAAISWFESAYDDTLFQAIYSNLIISLASGTGGLGGTIEQEIYDRAIARQVVDNDAKYREIEEYASSRGFELPTGAMMGRLQEQANIIAANNLDLNGKILIEQAELAQKNQQFTLSALSNLENLLRDYENNKNNRSLDYAKAVASIAIQRYAEQLRGYIAAAEANKIYVETQIAVMNAAVAANKSMVDQFIAEASVFEAEINAIGKKNEAITDVYQAELAGYDSETKAISDNQRNIIASYELKIRNAEATLNAQIAEAEAFVKGYGAEYGLRERVAEAQSNIAMQAMSSAYGAVNASAGLSYNGSESNNESWSHSEARSDNYSHSETISNSSGINKSISNSLSEDHGYTEN